MPKGDLRRILVDKEWWINLNELVEILSDYKGMMILSDEIVKEITKTPDWIELDAFEITMKKPLK